MPIYRRQSDKMRYYSTLAGPIQRLGNRRTYTVRFSDLYGGDNFIYRYWTRFVAYGSLLLVLTFAFVLLQPSHWIVNLQPESSTKLQNWIMLVCLIILQIFSIIGTFSAARATVKAKNPIPVRTPLKTRVAFVTTRAPGEPINMALETLQAALRVRHPGMKVDVWLLDETNDPKLRTLCKKMKVRHFSRKGVPEWNQEKLNLKLWQKLLHICYIKRYEKPNPFHYAKTKHGNFNAWREHLRIKHIWYDVLCGVDTDHVPEPNYLERMLGYFRDRDVAFVVGPQVYGNCRPGLGGLVVRWAESQASFFQSTIQRAGNATTSAMFVGTNYAIRFSALDQIGGFQPCITEDMATGLAIHSRRNPETGNRWKSVYTPDVVAVGEGPDFWGPFFTQQWRWAAGNFDTWRSAFWHTFFKLSRGAKLYYFLILTFYPITALTWLLGIISSSTYLLTGGTAILAPWNQFLTLYLMSMVMQMSLYFWNRRFNPSPFDPIGSYGVPGMAMTSLTAPIYLSALIGITFGKKPNFVVTKKGSSENPDNWQTFKIHLYWIAFLIVVLGVGILQGHTHPAMLVWVALQLAVCLLPIVLAYALTLSEKQFHLPRVARLIRGGEPTHA